MNDKHKPSRDEVETMVAFLPPESGQAVLDFYDHRRSGAKKPWRMPQWRILCLQAERMGPKAFSIRMERQIALGLYGYPSGKRIPDQWRSGV